MFSVEHLNRLRQAELTVIEKHFPAGARILEIGAGTGQQAFEMTQHGFDVAALDLADSNYAEQMVFPITRYDGATIPFPDASFDVVFSSNVLEHVRDLAKLHAETRRVLRQGGRCVHVLPTDAWRFWTTISAFPVAGQYLWRLAPNMLPRRVGVSEGKRLLGNGFQAAKYLTIPFRQRRHGERGNLLTEQWYFRPAWWRRHFREHHFDIVAEEPIGIFYTGHMIFNSMTLERRRRLARMLGSACHLFELRPQRASSA